MSASSPSTRARSSSATAAFRADSDSALARLNSMGQSGLQVFVYHGGNQGLGSRRICTDHAYRLKYSFDSGNQTQIQWFRCKPSVTLCRVDLWMYGCCRGHGILLENCCPLRRAREGNKVTREHALGTMQAYVCDYRSTSAAKVSQNRVISGYSTENLCLDWLPNVAVIMQLTFPGRGLEVGP